MELFDRLLEYMDQAFGFTPGPAILFWVLITFLLWLAIKAALSVINEILDLLLKWRELGGYQTSHPGKKSKKKRAKKH